MTKRACCILLGSLIALSAYGTDYALTVSEPSLKDSGTLLLFGAPSGLGAGDRIVKVVFGGQLRGNRCRVAPGSPSPTTMPLTVRGAVEGFVGEVRLVRGEAPRRSYDAALAVIPEGLAQMAKAKSAPAASAKSDASNSGVTTYLLAACLLLIVGITFKVWFGKSDGGGLTRSQEREIKEMRERLLEIAPTLEALVESRSQRQEALDQVSALRTALQEWSQRVPSADNSELAEIQSVKQRVEDLASKLDQSLARLDEFKTELAALPTQPSGGLTAETLTAGLQEAFSGLDSKLQDLSQSLAKVETKVGEAQAASGGEAATVDVSPVVSALAESNAALDSRLKELGSAVEALGARLEAASSANSDASVDPAALEAAAKQAADRAVEGLGASLAEIRAALERVESAAAHPTSDASDAGEAGDAFKSYWDVLSQQLAAMQAQIAELAAKPLTTSDTVAAVDVAGIETKLAELAERQTETQGLATSFAELSAALQELRSHAQTSSETLGELARAQAELTGRLEPGSEAETVGEAAKAITAMGRTLLDVNSRVEALAARFDALDAGMTTLAQTVEKGASEVAPSGSVEEFATAFAELSERIAASEGAIEKLSGILLESASSGPPDEATLNALTSVREELAALHARLSAGEETLVSLKDQLAALAAASVTPSGSSSEEAQRLQEMLRPLMEVPAAVSELRSQLATQANAPAESAKEVREELSRLAQTIESEASGMNRWEQIAEAISAIQSWQREVQAHLDDLTSGIAGEGAASGDPAALSQALERVEARFAALEERLLTATTVAGGTSAPEVTVDIAPLAAQVNKMDERLSAGLAALQHAVERLKELDARAPAHSPIGVGAESHKAEAAPRSVMMDFEDDPAVSAPKHYTIESDLPTEAGGRAVGATADSGGPTDDGPGVEFEEYVAQGDGKRVTPWQWLGEAGSPERHYSSEAHQSLDIDRKNAVPRAITPTDTPDCASPLRQVLYALGFVVYAHGDTIRGFWPGKDPRSVPLSKPLPPDTWRMLAHNGRLYCAQEDKVEIVHLGLWAKVGGFDGTYLDQLYSSSHWVGVKEQGGNIAVELRNDSGEPTQEPIQLKIAPSDYLMSASSENEVFLATKSGKVHRVDAGGAKQIYPAGKGASKEIASIAVYNNALVVAHERPGVVTIDLIEWGGKPVGSLEVEVGSPAANFVLMGDRLFLVDQDGPLAIEVDLKNLSEVRRVRIPGVSEVRHLCGLHDATQHLLLFVGVDAAGAGGQAILFEPETGFELKLCAVGINSHSAIIPAEGRTVVATSNDYQNIVRVFDPFSHVARADKAA